MTLAIEAFELAVKRPLLKVMRRWKTACHGWFSSIEAFNHVHKVFKALFTQRHQRIPGFCTMDDTFFAVPTTIFAPALAATLCSCLFRLSTPIAQICSLRSQRYVTGASFSALSY